jgi:hypothetical protein
MNMPTVCRLDRHECKDPACRQHGNRGKAFKLARGSLTCWTRGVQEIERDTKTTRYTLRVNGRTIGTYATILEARDGAGLDDNQR